nr:hypothetical protein [Tanacetum cinerariifolium]
MSDSEDSTVTYTVVSSSFEGLSDIGYPRVEGPPMMPEDPYVYILAAFQAPLLPDYVPGPKEPEQAPPLPEFVPELVYLKFMPLEDEILLAEEQPLPVADSPTTDSSRYIANSDLEEDPTYYLADEGTIKMMMIGHLMMTRMMMMMMLRRIRTRRRRST